MAKPLTVALDFDGVINSYTSEFTTPEHLPDPPVEGAIVAIKAYLNAGLEVLIISTRCSTSSARQAMRNYLVSNGLTYEEAGRIVITNMKMRAHVYIDDRGFRFEGTFPSVEQLKALRNPRPSKRTNIELNVTAASNVPDRDEPTSPELELPTEHKPSKTSRRKRD